MNRHHARPACWTDQASSRASSPPSPWGDIRECSGAETPERWLDLIDKTPGCSGCKRAFAAIVRWTDNDRRHWRKLFERSRQ
jgi:hypothetical protein